MDTVLFPMSEAWWIYAAFSLFVLILLGLDLGVFHRKDHIVSRREATIWICVWAALALLFNFGLYQYSLWKFDDAGIARRLALEFLAGYLVEESLSLDNIFVFIVIIRHFAIPSHLVHRVLFLGILGAILFRGIFIALGAVIMQYHWVVILLGVFLIFTGARLLLLRHQTLDPEQSSVRLLKRFLPVTHEFHGHRFLVRFDGKTFATPLLVALIAIETTDIVFAIDSVPAVFGLTREPLIVFTSNIFAILGLRSLYFVLADAMDRFHLLQYGLAVVLIFVGAKMSFFSGIPITVSLAVIAVVLGGAVGASLAFPAPAKAEVQSLT